MELLSEEFQMRDSKKGFLTSLVNKDIQKAFGQDDPVLSKKNLQALYYFDQWVPYTPKRKAGLPTVPLVVQQDLLAQTFHDAASNKVDANTALRQLDEKLKQELEKDKNK